MMTAKTAAPAANTALCSSASPFCSLNCMITSVPSPCLLLQTAQCRVHRRFAWQWKGLNPFRLFSVSCLIRPVEPFEQVRDMLLRYSDAFISNRQKRPAIPRSGRQHNGFFTILYGIIEQNGQQLLDAFFISCNKQALLISFKQNITLIDGLERLHDGARYFNQIDCFEVKLKSFMAFGQRQKLIGQFFICTASE